MTAREAARRYSAIDERAPVGFATALLHHWRGHDPIDRLERRGEFPKRIVLSGRKVCWDLREVQAWHRTRKAQRDSSFR